MWETILTWGAWLVGILWLVTATGQSIYTIAYAWWGRKSQSTVETNGAWPTVTVVMAVRGTEGRLEQSLQALSNLDYPQYSVFVAVDHPDDPAADICARFVRSEPNPIELRIAGPPQFTGGLKCERLVGLLDSAPTSSQIVAFVDADVVPTATWLKQLVSPLVDPSVAVTCGNRWFAPATWSVPETFRLMWNAAAVVQMEWYSIPWGGSMAIRRECIEQWQLRQTWSQTFCEDTILAEQARQHGQKVTHAPDVVMMEQADISWASVINWHARQLLAVRLHHPAWPLVCLHAWNGLILSVATLFLLVGTAANWKGSAAMWLLGCYLIYSLVSLGLLQLVALRNRYPFSLAYLAWCWLLMPVVQLTHSVGVARVMLMRHVIWSQINYQIGSQGVERLDYRVYRAQAGSQ